MEASYQQLRSQYLIFWKPSMARTSLVRIILPCHNNQKAPTNGKQFSMLFIRVHYTEVMLQHTRFCELFALQALLQVFSNSPILGICHMISTYFNFQLIKTTTHIMQTHYSRSAFNIACLQTENMLLLCLRVFNSKQQLPSLRTENCEQNPVTGNFNNSQQLCFHFKMKGGPMKP